MLPRRERYSREQLAHALRGGVRRSSTHFSVLLPYEGRGSAVIVPKKVARLATTRHRIKRRVFGALEHLSYRPRAVVLFPRAGVLTMRYDELVTELTSLLRPH